MWWEMDLPNPQNISPSEWFTAFIAGGDRRRLFNDPTVWTALQLVRPRACHELHAFRRAYIREDLDVLPPNKAERRKCAEILNTSNPSLNDFGLYSSDAVALFQLAQTLLATSEADAQILIRTAIRECDKVSRLAKRHSSVAVPLGRFDGQPIWHGSDYGRSTSVVVEGEKKNGKISLWR